MTVSIFSILRCFTFWFCLDMDVVLSLFCLLQLKFESKGLLKNTTLLRYESPVFHFNMVCLVLLMFLNEWLTILEFEQSTGKLDAYMERRRRKNAAKDSRYVPYGRSSKLDEQEWSQTGIILLYFQETHVSIFRKFRKSKFSLTQD